MAAAKPMKQNDNPIARDPTFGLVIMQHKPITIKEVDCMLDRSILRLWALKKICPEGLQMR